MLSMLLVSRCFGMGIGKRRKGGGIVYEKGAVKRKIITILPLNTCSWGEGEMEK